MSSVAPLAGMPSQYPDDRPLTMTEAMAFLGVSRRTMQRMLKDGRLAAGWKIGAAWRFWKADLAPRPFGPRDPGVGSTYAEPAWGGGAYPSRRRQ